MLHKLVNKEGEVRYRYPSGFYGGKKWGTIQYWPEMLDDLIDGYHYEGFYDPLPTPRPVELQTMGDNPEASGTKEEAKTN